MLYMEMLTFLDFLSFDLTDVSTLSYSRINFYTTNQDMPSYSSDGIRA